MQECQQSLAALKPPPCPSRLFSVGVRSDFPTSLVTDHLYPKFGRDSDVSAPPVLPLVRPRHPRYYLHASSLVDRPCRLSRRASKRPRGCLSSCARTSTPRARWPPRSCAT